jgi:hypothetical protein
MMPGLRRSSTRTTRTARRSVRRKTARPNVVIAAAYLPQNTSKNYAKKIRSYLDAAQIYGRHAKRYYGNQPRIRTLSNAMTKVSRHLQKANVVNPQTITALANLQRSLRGFSSCPQTLKTHTQKLFQHFRTNVRRDAQSFLLGLQRLMIPVQAELSRLEGFLQRRIRSAKGSKTSFRLDPMIRRQLTSYNNQIKRFKTRWYPWLNRFAANGSKDVQRQIASFKSQIQQIQKHITKSISYTSQASRYKRSKTRTNQTNFVSRSEVSRPQNQWNTVEKQFSNYRIPMERYIEQLRAVKSM